MNYNICCMILKNYSSTNKFKNQFNVWINTAMSATSYMYNHDDNHLSMTKKTSKQISLKSKS